MEPTGELEDDLNVADQRFSCSLARSYRNAEPVRVVRKLEDWPWNSEEIVRAMREGLAELRCTGQDEIIA